VATDSSNHTPKQVLVCQHRSCQAEGSADVLAAFAEAAEETDFKIKGTDCQGQCSCGPTVRVVPEETWYYRVQPSDVRRIVEQHLKDGKPVDEKLNPRIHRRFSF